MGWVAIWSAFERDPVSQRSGIQWPFGRADYARSRVDMDGKMNFYTGYGVRWVYGFKL